MIKEKLEDAFLWCMLPVTLTAVAYNRITQNQERMLLEREVQRLKYENRQLIVHLRHMNSRLSEMKRREMPRP